MLGNIVVYLFLAIIIGVAVLWAVYAWEDSRAKGSARAEAIEAGLDGLVPPP